ncbi:MAG TPA: RlmE family RNA methyltransferase [Polyangiaceae bacterium]|nr:RlmE family RNA methyltransferase [Polyangiaceae bacterium]
MSGRKGNAYEKPDARTKAAKAQGFPARSVFKLEEIDRRVKLLRAGQKVLDLGAAPGSWSLYASQKVGVSGRVLAIDLQEIRQAFPPNVKLSQGDALTLENAALSEFAPYDVVLSDMAPNTSGSKIRDQAGSLELCLRALDVALALGKVGSHFVAKIFMSGDFQIARKIAGERYEKCQVIRPEGTRQQSTEVFIVGLGLKAPATTP